MIIDTPFHGQIIITDGAAIEQFQSYMEEVERHINEFKAPSYTVATVPAADGSLAAIIYVSDESGGATIAFSDGANWLRVQDRAIIT